MLSIDKLFPCSRLYAVTAMLFAGSCLAQTHPSSAATEVNLNRAKQQYRNSLPRELTVLSETLSAAQFDRAGLNRLMQEISTEPASTKAHIGINDSQLQELFVIISNARGFINGSEIANVRAMCAAWNESAASDDARITEAIVA